MKTCRMERTPSAPVKAVKFSDFWNHEVGNKNLRATWAKLTDNAEGGFNTRIRENGLEIYVLYSDLKQSALQE